MNSDLKVLSEAYQKVLEQQKRTDAPGMYEKLRQHEKSDNELYNNARRVDSNLKDQTLILCYKALVMHKDNPNVIQSCIKLLDGIFNNPESIKEPAAIGKIK